jgi:hypothetical protein
MAHTEPPFDGSPCPVCPTLIRQLYSVANNTVVEFKRTFSVWPTDAEEIANLEKKISHLEKVVAEIRPLVTQHFADPKHAIGDQTWDDEYWNDPEDTAHTETDK